ncbi:ATP-binding protein [Marinomonas sp. NPDC078689]|uniref:ATP-binding protein n=1 Tax=Marinomonas sp. NPDC078689 TaxID=3364147 RepID=UPI0037C96FB6
MTRIPKKMLFPTTMITLFLVVVLVGWSNYRLFENRYVTQLTLEESGLLSQGSSLFNRELGHIKSTTLFLRNSVYALLTSHHHIPESVFWQSDISQIFSQFALTSPFISQVRWLDSNGKELIRINARDGKIAVVPASQLQDKSDRYYFQQAKLATENDVYISPVDLNMENDQIVRPLEPTLRGAVSINRERQGVLVVNYDLTKLFAQLRTLSNDRFFMDVVSENGEWLISQDAQKEWASALKQDKQTNYVKSLYPKVWASISSEEGLSSRISEGQVWSSMRVIVEAPISSMETEQSSFLYFVARSRSHVLDEYREYLQWLIFSLGSAAFLILSFLVWWQMNASYKRRALLSALEAEQAQLKVANNEFNVVNHQLVELQSELVENSKLSALGLMVAGLAHEMNTPLGGVRMALSSLTALINKEADSLSDRNRQSMGKTLEIAEKNLTRAINLVASFKRITLDRSGQDVQDFVLNSVLQDLLTVYKPRLKRFPHVLIKDECDADIHMQGFPGILSQVIQNLIDNALQHGLKDYPKGIITLTAKCQNDMLALSVKDNGNGISSEVRERIFDPFVTTGRVDKHTGLGLHLVHQWVYTLMKGRIEIESKEGEGTSFTIIIPLVQTRDVSLEEMSKGL